MADHLTHPAGAEGGTRLSRSVMAHAVRLIEQDGPLEDGQAMREAFAAQTGREQRLLDRAWRLGRRLGLDREWARWRQMASGVVLLLVVLVVVGAWGLAHLVLGDARQVNAVAAFASLLGLHALTLLAWCAGLLLPMPAGGAALGRLALSLTARLPLDRGPHALEMLRATTEVLRRARLAPWAFGWLSHTIWVLSFAVLLAALGFAFSLRAYRLTWETTILTPEFFVQFVQWTGALPKALGFPMPDPATLLQPDAANADHRAWAWWLMGCVAVYGFGVRLLCAGLSWAMWRRGQARLRLDLAEPYFRRLLARFDEMEPAVVVDREQRPQAPGADPPPSRAAADPASRALIGFELPPEIEWPPLSISVPPAPQGQVRQIAGAHEERIALLQALAQARPERLLIVCHAPSSPDRGTERFLREAVSHAAHAGLWLVGAAREADVARWRDWLLRTELPQIALQPSAEAAANWLQCR